MNMDIKRRIELITREPVEEVVTHEDLRKLLETKNRATEPVKSPETVLFSSLSSSFFYFVFKMPGNRYSPQISD